MSHIKVLVAALFAIFVAISISLNAGVNRTEDSVGLVLFVLLIFGPAGLLVSLIALVCLMKTRFLLWAITSLVFFAVLWGGVVTCGLLKYF